MEYTTKCNLFAADLWYLQKFKKKKFCVIYEFIYTGKSYTMMGNDVSAQSLGIMPCAIAWLFRLIDEQKEKTGARFSVRVSAVEVSGKNEQLKDLLADVAKCKGTLLITCFCHFFFLRKKDAIGWITSILVEFLSIMLLQVPQSFHFLCSTFFKTSKT